MNTVERCYLAIDLKSFYASAECVSRGLDPLRTNLVVADVSRTEKTICLAVSPSLKSYGISGRARLFEVNERVREINAARLRRAPGHAFSGKSYLHEELLTDPSLELDFIAAPPRMSWYVELSTKIYNVYLRYIAPEDIHVYSIDEVIMDVTDYLHSYRKTARELAMDMIRDVLALTGITATAGIGTNMYLCKIAMDIMAKHASPDENGVRIAELDEMTYRRELWDHRPITDFWRVGSGIARRLEQVGIYTMGDIALCSEHNEELFYKLFGVNAELLIDHAWGYEPCRMQDVKSYRPETNSLSSGQVLKRPYTNAEALTVLREMAEQIALQLTENRLVTDQLALTVNYDRENLTNPDIRAQYSGKTTVDRYGREIPEHAHGTANIPCSASSKRITEALVSIYRRTTNPVLTIRRLTVAVNHILPESELPAGAECEQLGLFSDPAQAEREREEAALVREKRRMEAMVAIRQKYGKNAILRASSLLDEATARERNSQIGGHRA